MMIMLLSNLIILFVFSLTNLVRTTDCLAIDRRATKKGLYSFQFSYFKSSDEESESGSAGFKYNGYLRPFGQIQGGGKFDYDSENGYGGKINVGTTDTNNLNHTINGLEAVYQFNQTSVDIVTGISAFDQKANFQLNIAQDGTIDIQFDLHSEMAGDLVCQPSDQMEKDGNSNEMICTFTTNAN